MLPSQSWLAAEFKFKLSLSDSRARVNHCSGWKVDFLILSVPADSCRQGLHGCGFSLRPGTPTLLGSSVNIIEGSRGPPGTASVPLSQSNVSGSSDGLPVSEHHIQEGLHSKVFSHIWGGWKVQDQGVQGVVSGEDFLPGLQRVAFSLFPHVMGREGER